LADFSSRLPGPEPVESVAARWMQTHPPRADHRLAAAMILKAGENPGAIIGDAKKAVDAGGSDPHSRQVFFRSHPIGTDARIAMVYPGSGNHYLGMGCDLALRFPASSPRWIGKPPN
jgi:acyl transferase domain-containing protein